MWWDPFLIVIWQQCVASCSVWSCQVNPATQMYVRDPWQSLVAPCRARLSPWGRVMWFHWLPAPCQAPKRLIITPKGAMAVTVCPRCHCWLKADKCILGILLLQVLNLLNY